MVKNFQELMEVAKTQTKMRLAVAAAQDDDVLIAVVKAAEAGLVEPILVGDKAEILKLAKENDLSVNAFQLIEADSLEDAAAKSAKLVSEGQADFLMKGLIDTSILLKAVLDKSYGLRTDSLLSHVMLYQVPAYHKMLFLTDGGMNIAPTVDEKVKIIANAAIVAKAMGMDIVKVACLAAKEKANPKMPATMDAAELEARCKAGAFEEGVIVEGPLAFDLAISEEAARIKHFGGAVAGDADILMVPNIEVGNGIGKALSYFANSESAGIIMGAKVPVVLVSRADSYETKLNSIALGSVIAAYK